MRIRQANRADIPALLPLAKGLIDVEQHLNTWDLTEALAGADWVSTKREPDFGCLVAEDGGGTLVGLACYDLLHASPAAIARPMPCVNGVFVAIDRRRRGIGSDLMRALASEGGRRGCGPMAWQVIDGDSVAARFSSQLGASAHADPSAFCLSADAVHEIASTHLESEDH